MLQGMEELEKYRVANESVVRTCDTQVFGENCGCNLQNCYRNNTAKILSKNVLYDMLKMSTLFSNKLNRPSRKYVHTVK